MRAAVALVSLLLSLLVVEVVLRYRAHRSDQRRLQAVLEGDEVNLGSLKRPCSNERIIFELRPNLRDVVFKGVPVSTNSLGFRGREVAETKPPGVVRIVGIGDSIMFGWGVREEESYLARLEQALNESHPERRWEVINTGVPGYNTVMEVETLREKGVPLDPDIVVVGLVNNDLNLPTLLLKKKDHLALDTLYFRDYVLECLGIVQPPTDFFMPVDRGDTNFQLFEQDPELVKPELRHMVGWEPFEKALDELEELSREEDFEVLVLRLWWYSILEKMEEKAAAHGFTTAVVVPEPEMRSDDVDWALEAGLKLSEEDGHPTAKMHGMTAAVVLARMEESGIIARAIDGTSAR